MFLLALFALFYDVSFPSVSIPTILSFIEFLADNHYAAPTIHTYISSIKSKFNSVGLSVSGFFSPQVSLALISLSKNWVPNVSLKPVFSPSQFLKLILQSSSLPLHVFYKVSFIFSFMALLRISNLAPPSSASFDALRHLRRGDVTLTHNAVTIFIRWTKTLQRHRQSARITLFSIPGSPVCPVQAFSALQRQYPVRASDPFLSYRISGSLFIFSQSHLRRALKRLVSALSFNKSLSFHSFRRSGASLAFASGVPFQAIQAHGTWTSDALWSYIDAVARDPAVAQCFSKIFSSL
jgi:integrase